MSGRALDGVAVVSDIVASLDPLQSARRLFETLTSFKRPPAVDQITTKKVEDILAGAARLILKVKETNPLVHQVRF